jgi:pimeloyl-ACP methyl ester carboxylesterase
MRLFRRGGRLHWRLLWVAAAALTLPACVPLPARSYVDVERLDLRTAYREYTDNVIGSGRYSQSTRQILNLVPEAGGGSDPDRALAALAASPRIDDTERAFARAELALATAEQLNSRDPAGARAYYLVAAHESARLLFPRGRAVRVDPFDQRYRLATAYYSLASGRYFLALMRPEVGFTGDLLEQTPDGPFAVTFENDDSSLIAYFFADFEIAWGVRIDGLRNRYARDGLGVPLIARRAPGDTFSLEAYLPAGGYTAPMTTYLHFDPQDAPGPERVRVALVDARSTDHVCFGRQRVPIAADFTAPYARQVVQDRSREAGRAALFGRRVEGTRFGITISAPWDPDKIPLVMVHGLASSAEVWRELTNDLLGSEELRNRYQIIHYTYPTTEPVLAAALRFRTELAAFLQHVGYDPAVSPKLVVVGHSMGGLLAKTLVVDSGREIWDRMFTVAPDELQASDAVRARFEHALILESWPSIGRVIFLGVPHRGSDAADGLLGWVGKRLIHVPSDFVELLQASVRADESQVQETVRDWFRDGSVTSVQSLSPTYPAMQGLAALPIAPGLPYHSVIGDVTKDGRGRPSDGYVTVESAHLDGAASELVLPIEHEAFDRAAPLNEVYRILRLHAQALGMPETPPSELVCREDGSGAAERAAAGPSAPQPLTLQRSPRSGSRDSPPRERARRARGARRRPRARRSGRSPAPSRSPARPRGPCGCVPAAARCGCPRGRPRPSSP